MLFTIRLNCPMLISLNLVMTRPTTSRPPVEPPKRRTIAPPTPVRIPPKIAPRSGLSVHSVPTGVILINAERAVTPKILYKANFLPIK
ncbi:hypothetical protein D3C71_1594610 [compost metagenome]